MPARDLNLVLLQQDLHWEDGAANRAAFEPLVRAAAGADLVVLPEMFNTGFSMRPEAVAESPDGPTTAWMRALAAETGAMIAGSVALREREGFRNRLLCARPDGGLEGYDKHHLFRHSGENLHYTPGRERRIVDWRGWRLCLQVCYDLRFPVWCRNRGDYDALLFVANWPARRREHWRVLLQARAIENQCHVIGVNRIGLDGNGIPHGGDTLVVDPWGRITLDAGDAAGAFAASLSAQVLAECRDKFPVHHDADEFELL